MSRAYRPPSIPKPKNVFSAQSEEVWSLGDQAFPELTSGGGRAAQSKSWGASKGACSRSEAGSVASDAAEGWRWQRAPPGWLLLTPNWGRKSGEATVLQWYGDPSENEAHIQRAEMRAEWERVSLRHVRRMAELAELDEVLGDTRPLGLELFQLELARETDDIFMDGSGEEDSEGGFIGDED